MSVIDGDSFKYAFRLAAFNYMAEVERAQAEKQRAEQAAKKK